MPDDTESATGLEAVRKLLADQVKHQASMEEKLGMVSGLLHQLAETSSTIRREVSAWRDANERLARYTFDRGAEVRSELGVIMEHIANIEARLQYHDDEIAARLKQKLPLRRVERTKEPDEEPDDEMYDNQPDWIRTASRMIRDLEGTGRVGMVLVRGTKIVVAAVVGSAAVWAAWLYIYDHMRH